MPKPICVGSCSEPLCSKCTSQVMSCAGIGLKESRGHVIGLRDAELMAPPSLGGRNLQLSPACTCSPRWNFSISSRRSSCPLSRAKPAAAAHQTVTSVHRGGILPADSWVFCFFFALGKDLCPYKPQVQRGFSLFPLFYKRPQREGGRAALSAPLGYVCHNYSVGQLSPSLIKR